MDVYPSARPIPLTRVVGTEGTGKIPIWMDHHFVCLSISLVSLTGLCWPVNGAVVILPLCLFR